MEIVHSLSIYKTSAGVVLYDRWSWPSGFPPGALGILMYPPNSGRIDSVSSTTGLSGLVSWGPYPASWFNPGDVTVYVGISGYGGYQTFQVHYDPSAVPAAKVPTDLPAMSWLVGVREYVINIAHQTEPAIYPIMVGFALFALVVAYIRRGVQLQ